MKADATDMPVQRKNSLERELAFKNAHISMLESEITYLKQLREIDRKEIRALKESESYRIGRIVLFPLRAFKMAWEFLKARRAAAPQAPSMTLAMRHAMERAERDSYVAKYNGLRARPLISVIMPVHNTPAPILREAIQSVFDQGYENWELCVADDASTNRETLEVLREYQSRGAGKIRPIRLIRLEANGGIAAASNAAAGLAAGEFLAPFDHDDLLTPDALLEVALRLEEKPEADLVYSDEDKVSPNGALFQPFHKPDYSPEHLLSNNYICHLAVMRRTVFQRIGGFHEGVDGSQDHDLFLRATEITARIEHIPKILYHWRVTEGSTAGDVGAKGGPWRESSRVALRAAVERRGWNAQVLNGIVPGTYRVQFAVDPKSRVTIVIPTKDRIDLLDKCVASIRAHTAHPSYEILVISNNSEHKETFDYLERRQREGALRFIRYDVPFNYSEINNFAARDCDSQFLLFLNNDVEVTVDGWLESMLEFAQQKEIGIVGAKLVYPDGVIQHSGIVLGINGVAGNANQGVVEETLGDFGFSGMIRNYSAVTGACLMMRREVFEEIGGFNEKLGVAFNDVDLCLEVRKAGYRIVYTPYARLIHHESASRGQEDNREKRSRFLGEIARMRAKWGASLFRDPYYNVNLTLCREDFSEKTDSDRAIEKAFMGDSFFPKDDGEKPALAVSTPSAAAPAGKAESDYSDWRHRFNSDDERENAFQIYDNWVTSFHFDGREYGAPKPLVTDHSPEIAQLNEAFPLKGARVLELGPLEGGRTKQMANLGASLIVGVESNPEAFSKCCLVKSVFGLDSARFVFGDFNAFMEKDGPRKTPQYDICVASGVLYHMEDPLHAIDLMAASAPAVYVWTCVASERAPTGEWIDLKDREGRIYRGRRNYYRTTEHLGGIHPSAVWLSEEDCLRAFQDRGCEIQRLGGEEHPNGRVIAFIAHAKGARAGCREASHLDRMESKGAFAK